MVRYVNQKHTFLPKFDTYFLYKAYFLCYNAYVITFEKVFIMNILVIDAQGGGIGKQIVSAIKQNIPDANITAVGTNGTATSAMLKAGADGAATGENAVVVGCRNADVIIGPIGIVVADSMLGEITPGIALAVAQSSAVRFLIPFNSCNTRIAGVGGQSVSGHIDEIINEVKKI